MKKILKSKVGFKYLYQMKTLMLLTIMGLSLFGTGQNTSPVAPAESLYDIEMNSLSGEKINFGDFKGKIILFVNVASKCGFTPQYEGLQKLHETYKDRLVIIGVPCNQFGSQEPGTNDEIATFCQKNYGVDFLITEKVDVKGDEQHPLYQWLTDKSINSTKSTSVKWNFEKYLVDEKGQYLDHFISTTKPGSDKISVYLK